MPASPSSCSARPSDARLVRHRRVEHVALFHVVVLLAQRARRVQRIVDDHSQLAGRIDRHREHVDALAAQQLRHAAQGARTVGQLDGDFPLYRHARNVAYLLINSSSMGTPKTPAMIPPARRMSTVSYSIRRVVAEARKAEAAGKKIH